MEPTNQSSPESLLFTYGTLLRKSNNQVAKYLRRHSAYGGSGSFSGKLFDVGPYPGATWDPASPHRVYGEIVCLTKPEQVLAVMDEYEGFGPTYPPPYLFVRQLVPVQSDRGEVNCWVYLYNRPTSTLSLIASGDYGHYLQALPK